MESPNPHSHTLPVPIAQPRTSDILARLANEENGDTITVGRIVDALSDRSFGVVIILFALPNTIFPVAWVLGTPILLLAVQMAFGQQRPWLPEFMRRQSFSRETFARIVSYVVHYLGKIEAWLQPRWGFLTTNRMERVIGIYMTIITIILLVPVPFGNALPSFGLAIIAAGLLEKDGVAIVVGALVGVAGAVYVFAVMGGIWAAAKAIFGF
jgi:hypothetical protein